MYYRLTEQTFIGGALRPAGTVVRHDGKASDNMVEASEAAFLAQRERSPADDLAGIASQAGPTRAHGLDPKWDTDGPGRGGDDFQSLAGVR